MKNIKLTLWEYHPLIREKVSTNVGNKLVWGMDNPVFRQIKINIHLGIFINLKTIK